MTTRILHVEDDADIRDLAQMALEMTGEFEVQSYESGLDALKDADPRQVDVFLFDLMMPDISGDLLLERFRQLEGFEATPTIFMTARAQPAVIETLVQKGALDVIAKPFDPMNLGSQIKAILAGTGFIQVG